MQFDRTWAIYEYSATCTAKCNGIALHSWKSLRALEVVFQFDGGLSSKWSTILSVNEINNNRRRRRRQRSRRWEREGRSRRQRWNWSDIRRFNDAECGSFMSIDRNNCPDGRDNGCCSPLLWWPRPIDDRGGVRGDKERRSTVKHCVLLLCLGARPISVKSSMAYNVSHCVSVALL